MSLWVSTTHVRNKIHNTRSAGFKRYAADADIYAGIAEYVMALYEVSIIGLHDFTVGFGDDAFCDHVHFTEGVRQQQAAFIAGWLSAYFAQ